MFAAIGLTHAADEGSPGDALVGKPALPLKFMAYNSHATFDLSQARGKMVVLDFFMAEKNHDTGGIDDLADVERDYGPKGVIVWGISADMNPSAVTALLKKKSNIDWPIDYDPNGFSGKTCIEWKESRHVGGLEYQSYYHLDYIIGPDGIVLWTGLPDQLSHALDEQLKDHKPTLVDPAIMSDASAALEKMRSALTDNNVAEAVKQRRMINSAALADDDFAAKVKDADVKLKDASEAELKSIDDEIAATHYKKAASRLNRLESIDDESPLCVGAKRRFAALMRNPAARAAIDGDSNRLRGASSRSASPTTSSAAPSAAPTPVDKHKRATSLLHLADSYRDSGDYDKAKEKYQAVIKQFPSSEEAKTAQSEIEKLPS